MTLTSSAIVRFAQITPITNHILTKLHLVYILSEANCLLTIEIYF